MARKIRRSKRQTPKKKGKSAVTRRRRGGSRRMPMGAPWGPPIGGDGAADKPQVDLTRLFDAPRILNPRRRNSGDVLGRAKPTANIGSVWQLYTTNTYRSGDLPSLATREAVQNSKDAIEDAVKAGQIKRGEGRIDVVWDPDKRTLSWADNGIGMDLGVLRDKFLSIGDSTKRGAATSMSVAVKGYRRSPGSGNGAYYIRLNGLFQFRRSAQMGGEMPLDVTIDYTTNGRAGGFGVAKAVILGVSPSFRWEIHTRDLFLDSPGKNADGVFEEGEIRRTSWRQGTKLTVKDIPRKYDSMWDDATGGYRDLHARLRDVLAFNDLRGITLTLNGREVKPHLQGRRGRRISLGGDWGSDPNPATPGYPFNTGRDSLRGAAASALLSLAESVEKQAKNITSALSDVEQLDPEEESSTRDDLRDGVADAFADPEFLTKLGDGAAAAADMLTEVMKAQRGMRGFDGESTAPGTPPRKREEVTPASSDRAAAGALRAAQTQEKTATTLTKAVLKLAEGDKKQDAEEEKGYVTRSEQRVATEEAGKVFKEVLQKAGVSADRADRASDEYASTYSVEGAVNEAVEKAMAPEGGGVAQAALVIQAAQSFAKRADIKVSRNPFGKLAGLRVYKKLTNMAYVRRFKKQWAKHVPLLTLWDSACRLIARMGAIKSAFKPGFVFNDQRGAECAIQYGKPALILLNPQYAYAYIKANKERPWAIAAYILGIAAHEMAHLSRGEQSTGKHEYAHGDDYAQERERLGDITAVLGPAVAVLVVKLLGIKDPAAEATAKLTRERDKARERARKYQIDAGRFRRAMEKAQQDACKACAKKQPRWVKLALDPATQARVEAALRDAGRRDTAAWMRRQR